MRALVVDDNEQNLYLLKTSLESAGFEVVLAQNGSEALEQAHKVLPDLIISDILMPVMDGFELCAQWTRDKDLSRVPFIFYTATYTDPADEALGLSLGAARFIVKPQEHDVFLRAVTEVLQQFEKGQLADNRLAHSGPGEQTQYRLYSQVLIRKLEAKMMELDASRQALEREIKERKRVESELRLHAQVFAHAHEGILIADSEEKILTVNQSFLTLTGYTEPELSGQPPFMLNAGPHDSSFFQSIRSALIHDSKWQGEVWIRDKSGNAQPMWMNVSGLRSEKGQLLYFIAMLLDISEQKTQAAQIDRLAFFDAITGLPNRALLMDRLEQILARSVRSKEPAAIFFMNLDRFREINEGQGHAAGDYVLQEVTQRFSAVIDPGMLLARFGGDEFVIVRENTDQAAADFTAARLAQCLAQPIAVADQSLAVGTSIGVSLFPADGASADELIRHAVIAMHRAKAANRTHLFFRSDMSVEIARRTQVAARLAKAIADSKLQLYFQPQFELASGRLTGAEALLRWHDSEWGWVSPGEFIPLAESRGLIIPLGEWVMKEACRHVQVWLAAGLAPPRISVNVSALQLGDRGFVEKVTSICEKARLAPSMFEMELTESGAMQDPEQSSRVLLSLREAGFRLAIDDFGVAYSSLVYLKRFSADKLKIDMSFVRGMIGDPNDRAIVSTIIGIARGLGMRTLAEGVELPVQSELLLSMGCDDVQGYLHGKPQPSELFEKAYLNAP